MGILIPARATVKPAKRHGSQQEEAGGDAPIPSHHGEWNDGID
jgi:hypothetical protein